MRVAISRCLLGQPVRYDGGSKPGARGHVPRGKGRRMPRVPRRGRGASRTEASRGAARGTRLSIRRAGRDGRVCAGLRRVPGPRATLTGLVGRTQGKEPVMRGESHLRWDLFRYAHRRGRHTCRPAQEGGDLRGHRGRRQGLQAVCGESRRHRPGDGPGAPGKPGQARAAHQLPRHRGLPGRGKPRERPRLRGNRWHH